MAEHRWSKFWWADWRGDPCLRICSLAARGLWMDLLCIAHEGLPQGHVTVNGRPPSNQQIAMIVGTDEKKVAALVKELEAAGVFSRDESGAIVSRRMVRDAARSEEGRANIARRVDRRQPTAPPTSPPTTLEAEAEAERKQVAARARGRQGANGAGPPRWDDASIVPEPSDHRPTVNGWYLDYTFDAALEAANIDPARTPVTWKPVIGWLKANIEPEVIVAAIRRCAERDGYEPPSTLAYFDKPVRQGRVH